MDKDVFLYVSSELPRGNISGLIERPLIGESDGNRTFLAASNVASPSPALSYASCSGLDSLESSRCRFIPRWPSTLLPLFHQPASLVPWLDRLQAGGESRLSQNRTEKSQDNLHPPPESVSIDPASLSDLKPEC